MQNSTYLGLKIGSIFTIISLALYLTIFIPIISIFPSSIIESILKAIFTNSTFSQIGNYTLATLITIQLSLIFIFWKTLSNIKEDQKLIKYYIIWFMILESFIIHSLIYYVGIVSSLNRIDGQLALYVMKTYPISSFGFILLGITMDLVIEK